MFDVNSWAMLLARVVQVEVILFVQLFGAAIVYGTVKRVRELRREKRAARHAAHPAVYGVRRPHPAQARPHVPADDDSRHNPDDTPLETDVKRSRELAGDMMASGSFIRSDGLHHRAQLR